MAVATGFPEGAGRIRSWRETAYADTVSGGPQQDRAQIDCDRDRRISIEGTFARPCG